LIGQTIKGYEIDTCVARGGFGAVYHAFQPSVKREVAVKVILPQFADKPDFIRRFEAEAQIIAQLEHPHIVPLYDYWRSTDGAYLVMRWLPFTLSASIKQHYWELQPTLRLLSQISAALTIAHRRNVIHRDIKPDNILLDEEANAYLADFGIAKSIEPEED